MKQTFKAGAAAFCVASGMAGGSITLSHENTLVNNINLHSLSANLPNLVRRHLGAVVSTELSFKERPDGDVHGKWRTPTNKVVTATAVRTSNDTFTTAGHAVYNRAFFSSVTEEKSIINNPCGKLGVEVSTKQPDAVTNVGLKAVFLHGSTLIVSKVIGSFVKGDKTAIPDIADLQVVDHLHNSLSPKISAPISSTPTKIGQAIYIVNYEPLNKVYRSPSESNVEQLNTAFHETIGVINPERFTTPAMIGALIVGYRSNGDIYIVDGFKTYDSQHDEDVNPGGSGGGDFNSDGQLVGINVKSTSTNKPFSASEIDRVFGVKLIGDDKDNLQIGLVQPVNKVLIKKLKSRLLQKQSCIAQ